MGSSRSFYRGNIQVLSMNPKSLIILMVVAFFATSFLLSSCDSNNDEPEEDNSSTECVIANGEKLKPTSNCVYSHTYDYYGHVKTYFSAFLQSEKDGFIYFDFKCGSGFKKDDELSISIIRYHSWTGIYFSSYEELRGRVIVENISEKNITLSFDNYTFKRGDDEFVINGTIKFREDGTVSE